ncbi:MAG: DNA primase [Betaproteobacteria bacterium]|nr:DNA primase [Betaproteobacteria bacterium]
MSASALIDRLDGVRRTGPGRWIAKCPAHDDRSPSLSVRETDDRLLVHCFAGCDALSIVNAVGLDLPDLFSEPMQVSRPSRKPALISARDGLEMVRREACFVAVVAAALGRGEAISDQDRDRLLKAAGRILVVAEEVA